VLWSRRWLVPAGAVALLALAVALDVGGIRGRLRGASGETIRSLAVLPLANLSRDPEQEYFADGMTEELITVLAGLDGVRVISRTSAMRYKGSGKSIPQIARELGVDAVVEGSALRAGDRVRITAQLIRGSADQHLWANAYERDLRDVLALQGEVARAIAAEIRTTLARPAGVTAQPPRAVDPKALEAYLKGRYHWHRRGAVPLRQAIAHFEQAIAIDPDYALAHVGLAEVYVVLSGYTGQPLSETIPRARAEAERALQLDPGLSGAHAVLGLAKANDYDWAGAQAELQEALRLNPNDASARHWLGLTLFDQGQFDAALAEIDRALVVDPLALIIRNNRGRILQAQRRFDAALAEFRNVAELDPAASIAHIWIARNHMARGRFEQAVARMRTADSLDHFGLHGYDALEQAARTGDARRFWRQWIAFSRDSTHRSFVFPSQLAECHAQLGESDRALALLEEAFIERDPIVTDMIREWSLDPIRSDPRFVALLRKYGLEP
jgi:TolB-like protein/Flp pilus assembly protein TadD